ELLPFVTTIAREREEALEGKGLSLDLRGDKGSGKVMADTRQLGRAIGNLLDNAIRATPEGGRILVALSRRKQGARIVISDNGEGMKPSELARAMDGYRIGADGRPEARRGGLGLPLARQLIEAHGGRLDMQSEKGAGTTATITLP
ncbi:MAG TPA: ATP-binding protein, partial [Croceibacterium sp.]|nr:ATP-binding protein [Croceibacterium sp.]